MEGRKTYVIELTRTELIGIISALDTFKFYEDDFTFEPLKQELETKLDEK